MCCSEASVQPQVELPPRLYIFLVPGTGLVRDIPLDNDLLIDIYSPPQIPGTPFV